MEALMVHLLSGLVILYVTLVCLMYVFQRNIMYLPETNIQSPAHYGLHGFTEEFIPGESVMLQLWHSPAKEHFPTVVYFHGNAGHIGDRAAILGALANKGFGVLAVNYRGYGKSHGSPTEEGIYHDARAALRYATETLSLPLGKIMLYGESLGTGVATHMATEFPVAALILQAPYKSVSGRAAEIYYFIPVNLLIKDKFSSISKIHKVKAPLLIFHGEQDPTIPVEHGKAMFEAATSIKRAHFMPGVAHNDFDSAVISAHVLDFAKEHQLVQ